MTAADPILVLTGPTAAGKKEIGLAAARRLGAEVVGLDSVKVYRGLDIGAAAPSAEERGDVPLHLVGDVDPTETFSVGRYVERAAAAVAAIRGRGRRVLFLGGTPLYLQALVRGLFPGPKADPALRERLQREQAAAGVEALHARLAGVDPVAAQRIHPHDFKRIARALEVFELTGRPIAELQAESTRPAVPGPFRLAGLTAAKPLLDRRILERVDQMLARGLLDEVRMLRERGAFGGEVAQAIGYREAAAVLDGSLSLALAREAMVRATGQLVRKQMKWFRRFPEIAWIERTQASRADELVDAVCAAFRGANAAG